MALLKAKLNELPEDAIRLTEEEALDYQLKLIKNWKHQSDVFAAKFGTGILSGCSVLAGVYFNNHFRSKYRLLGQGFISSLLPTCGIPALMTALTHSMFVLPDVLLRKGTCPVCVEMRASALQATIGGLLPLVLSSVSTLGLAHRFNTYNVPYVTSEPMKVLQLMRKQAKPISSAILAIFIAQAVVASVITFYEGEAVHKINIKLLQLEDQLENS